MAAYIKWFNTLGMNDVDLVGGKNASLGEMYQKLSKKGIRIPNGFAITAESYKHILDHNEVWEELDSLLKNLDPYNVEGLQKTGKACREIIYNCELPKALLGEIEEAYEALKKEYGDDVTLAVRSSATAEDSPEAYFAGQNETYLNVQGMDALVDAYVQCLASNFTDRMM